MGTKEDNTFRPPIREEVIAMYEVQLMKKRQGLDSLKQILYKLGTEEGIIEYEYQSQEIMRGYLGTVDGNNNSKINKKEVNRLLKNMENTTYPFMAL